MLPGTPPRRRSGPPVPRRAAPAPFSVTPPAELAPPGPAGSCAALPRRRPDLSPRAMRATPPAMALVAMPWLCCRAATVLLPNEFVSFGMNL